MGQHKLHLLEGILSNNAITVFKAQLARMTHATDGCNKLLTIGISVGMRLSVMVHSGDILTLNILLLTPLKTVIKSLYISYYAFYNILSIKFLSSLTRHRCRIRQIGRKLHLVDIKTYARDGTRKGIARECVLNKYAHNLIIASIYIVCPLYAALYAKLAQRMHQRQRYNLRQQKLLVYRQKCRCQHHRECDIFTLLAMPSVATLTTPCALMLSPYSIKMSIFRVTHLIICRGRMLYIVNHSIPNSIAIFSPKVIKNS